MKKKNSLLARHHTQITKKLRERKSHIKSTLLYQGITIPSEFDNSNWMYDFLDWLDHLKSSTLSRNLALKREVKNLQVHQIRIFSNSQSNASLLRTRI